MLDPHEPHTHTQDTTEQPSPPTTRRRRAASRPAGPPSTAPNAPEIERPQESPEPVSEDFIAVEITPPAEKTARKPAGKRTPKKRSEQTSPSDGGVAKPPRKRTAKKAVAMATEAPSDEVHALSAEPEVPAPTLQDTPPAEAVVVAVVDAEEDTSEAAVPEEPAREEPAPDAPAPELAAAVEPDRTMSGP